MKFSVGRRKLFWTSATAVAALLFGYACGHQSAPHPGSPGYGYVSEEESLSYRNCVRDEECVHTANGCCTCNGAGKDKISVNRDKLKLFEQEIKQRCSKGSVCPDGALWTECVVGGSACIQGTCTYIKPAWDSKKRAVYWEYPKGVRHYRENGAETDGVQRQLEIPGDDN